MRIERLMNALAHCNVTTGKVELDAGEALTTMVLLAKAERLVQKVMALRADQNSWSKEEEVYAAMVEYRAVLAERPGAPLRDEERAKRRAEFEALAAKAGAPPTGLLAGSPETAARIKQPSKGSP